MHLLQGDVPNRSKKTMRPQNLCQKKEWSFVTLADDRGLYQKRWISVLVQVNCEKKTTARFGRSYCETYLPIQSEIYKLCDGER